VKKLTKELNHVMSWKKHPRHYWL